ncbi:MAG: Hsp20/alpha crystallin family protein [Cyanophyceae cyanobacterium]
MAINGNNADFSGDRFNNNSDSNSNNNSAANHSNPANNWTQEFNREVAQRQASAMMEQVMAVAGKIQEQMQQQMQQMQDGGASQGFGFPDAAAPQGDVLRDSETAIIVSLTLPGLQEESVKVEVKDQVLHVTGEVNGAAVVPPGFPAPPVLGFTRIMPLPVAVHGDRTTIAATDSTISIILPKVEPGTLTDDQLRQMVTPPATANPMAGIFEAMMRDLSTQAGRRAPSANTAAKGNHRDRLARWQTMATENLIRWGNVARKQGEQVLAKIKEGDRAAMFNRQSQRHQDLLNRWAKASAQGRQWLGRGIN